MKSHGSVKPWKEALNILSTFSALVTHGTYFTSRREWLYESVISVTTPTRDSNDRRHLSINAFKYRHLNILVLPSWNFLLFLIDLLSFFSYFYFIGIDVLPECLSVWGCQIPWSWPYRQLWTAMLVLRIEARSSEEQPVLLTAEPSL